MTYFHGEQCRRNPAHGTQRYAKGKGCVACGRETAARRRAEEVAKGILSPRQLYPPEREMLDAALRRAKAHKVPFDLRSEDITPFPTHCPLLGIPLVKGKGVCGPNSPTLDRIKPALGYVKGNVMVISMKANQIKSNATAAEIRMVADAMALLEM